MADRVSAIYSTEKFRSDSNSRAEVVRLEVNAAAALETRPGAVADTMARRGHSRRWTNRNARRSWISQNT
jgi:hypothetical protein